MYTRFKSTNKKNPKYSDQCNAHRTPVTHHYDTISSILAIRISPGWLINLLYLSRMRCMIGILVIKWVAQAFHITCFFDCLHNTAAPKLVQVEILEQSRNFCIGVSMVTIVGTSFDLTRSVVLKSIAGLFSSAYFSLKGENCLRETFIH